MYTKRSRTFETVHNSEMGLSFIAREGSSFLNTGVTLARFQLVGTEPKESDMLKRRQRDGAIFLAVVFRSIPGSQAFLG